MTPPPYQDLPPSALVRLDPEVRLIDVREPDEFDGRLGHLTGAEQGTLEAASADWPSYWRTSPRLESLLVLPVGLSLAALMGLSLGLLGGGGSILTVPLFVYVLGFEPKESIAMGLAVVGATSLMGAARHWREGNVDLKGALTFGGLAMAGTYGGARLAAFVPGAVQLTLFAAVMLVAAWFMFRNGHGAQAAPRSGAGPRAPSFLLTVMVSLSVGLLTALAMGRRAPLAVLLPGRGGATDTGLAALLFSSLPLLER